MINATILQFGGGRFLRAFTDLFVQQANEAGQGIGQVVVLQSTDSGYAEKLNAQQGRFHVAIRGIDRGETIDTVHEVACVQRALIIQHQWEEIVSLARSPQLRFIISNTTEAGLALAEGDSRDAKPPASFPARLLALLRARFEAGLPGVAIIPCELREHNADLLLSLVLSQAKAWQEREALLQWLQKECVWINTLVDRIVTDRPPDYTLFPKDALLAVAEPYALWALENKPLPGPFPELPPILRVPDVEPYFLRKVRILNGAHTALLSQAMPRGYQTVREALADPEVLTWLKRLLFDEIVPTLEGRVEDPKAFAEQVLERFANPFLHHRLTDIAKNHRQKVPVRLLPTYEEYKARFGKTPRLLEQAIAFHPEGAPS